MKKITTTMLTLALGIISVFADPVVESYVSVNSTVTEASFPTNTKRIIRVPQAQASGVTMISSGFDFALPPGTIWARLDAINTGAEGVFDGNPAILVPSVSMMMSQWGMSTSPNIYAVNSGGVISMSGQLGASNITNNPTHFLITARDLELGRTTPPIFPKLVRPGDRFKVWVTAIFTWEDEEGVHTSEILSSEAVVEIIPDLKFAIANYVLGGDNRHYMTIVGLDTNIVDWDNYGDLWWIKRSSDLANWIDEPDASFITSGFNYVVVVIPKNSDKMFFRVGNP